MSNLSRRPGSGMSRTSRERRAFQLAIAGGTASAVAVVTFVLALVGVMGFGIPVLAVLIAVVCAWLFRRTVGT
jgi:hypothetical protein